jgi:hypothetical protein
MEILPCSLPDAAAEIDAAGDVVETSPAGR